MNFREYLIEQRIPSKAKRDIIEFIKNPPNSTQKYKIGDDTIIVKPSKDGVIFDLSAEMFEAQAALVDIIDMLGGYKYKSKTSGNTVEITVIPKEKLKK